jgi:hypothetical protein
LKRTAVLSSIDPIHAGGGPNLEQEESDPPRVIVVEYDPQWPILFGKEKLGIMDALGQEAVADEPIESTAVPGLGAGPPRRRDGRRARAT